MKTQVAVALLFLSQALIAQSDDSFQKSKRSAHLLEQQISSCAKREVVASFPRKRKTVAWIKSTWGPPKDVLADIKKNDSLLYPYMIVVEFWLEMKDGSEFATQEAARASDASTFVGRAHYRNIYLSGDDGLRSVANEILPSSAQSTEDWEKRHTWDDACWDNIKVDGTDKSEDRTNGHLSRDSK